MTRAAQRAPGPVQRVRLMPIERKPMRHDPITPTTLHHDDDDDAGNKEGGIFIIQLPFKDFSSVLDPILLYLALRTSYDPPPSLRPLLILVELI